MGRPRLRRLTLAAAVAATSFLAAGCGSGRRAAPAPAPAAPRAAGTTQSVERIGEVTSERVTPASAEFQLLADSMRTLASRIRKVEVSPSALQLRVGDVVPADSIRVRALDAAGAPLASRVVWEYELRSPVADFTGEGLVARQPGEAELSVVPFGRMFFPGDAPWPSARLKITVR